MVEVADLCCQLGGVRTLSMCTFSECINQLIGCDSRVDDNDQSKESDPAGSAKPHRTEAGLWFDQPNLFFPFSYTKRTFGVKGWVQSVKDDRPVVGAINSRKRKKDNINSVSIVTVKRGSFQ